ncbi:MAG: PTS IIA-like nitrogen regulatory protein PtsN [Pseudomonadales bacterium]
MLSVESILSPRRTLCGAPGVSKKRVLEHIANVICADQTQFNSRHIFDALIAREKLGSTALGSGIAIPHCRLNRCNNCYGTLITLADDGVDFDAIDNNPVDLLFVLLVPEAANEEHLQILAELARLFSDADYCARLRAAEDADALYSAAIKYGQ